MASVRHRKREIPAHYVDAIRFDLEENNKLYRTYRNFADYHPGSEDVYIELSEPPAGNEVAALYHEGFAPYLSAQSVYVQRAHDACPSRIPLQSFVRASSIPSALSSWHTWLGNKNQSPSSVRRRPPVPSC
jgi:hypothetical protein